MTWPEVFALAGLVVSQVWVLVIAFRAPAVEYGWGGGGSCATLPDAVHGLVLWARDKRAES